MDEELKIETVSASVVYEQDKAMTDVQIETAKKFPRNIKRAMENAIATVTIDTETAQTCNYSLPRGGKTISGPSVHLAKILAQTWGNMRVEAKVVAVDNTTLTSQAIAFDLENNLAIKVEVKRSIMTKKGRMNEDMQTVTGNAANAIALRNAILSVIPKAVVDKVYNSAKKAITGDLSDEEKLIKKRKAVFDGFKNSYNVTEQELLTLIGKPSIDTIDADDIVTLIGVAQAIKDGDTTVDDTFRKKPTGPKVNAESERISEFIAKAETLEDLEILKDQLTPETELAWQAKYKKISKDAK
jgi:hypothetical protein